MPSSSKSKLNRPKSKVQIDSGARLVESDSDVKIVPDPGDSHSVNLGGKPPSSATDSDVRLNLDSGKQTQERPRPEKDALLTEEIDLDAELRQAEEAARSKGPSGQAPVRRGAQLPTSSPFELSDDDLELPREREEGRLDGQQQRFRVDARRARRAAAS